MGTLQGVEAEGNIKLYLCPLLFTSSQLNKYFNFVPGTFSEMEFLDITHISLTKYLSLLLHAIHSPFYWRILKKTILFSGFKILTKIRKTIKLESIHE